MPRCKQTPIELWNPGLDNGHMTLREVYSSLPGLLPSQIPLIVRLIENPRSPIAFTGAVNLFNHDCIHILIGRGLLPQDEAFVIGYTMGTSKTIPAWQVYLFRHITRHIYRPPYNFADEDLEVFDLGLSVGKRCSVERIYQFDFHAWMDIPLDALRSMLKCDVGTLYAAYQLERALLPQTAASRRLPVRPERGDVE